MNRDNASLLDIVNAAKRVLKFAEGLDKSSLAVNEEKQSAILYQVIVMGDATKRLSSEFRVQHPEIPWKDILLALLKLLLRDPIHEVENE